MRKNFPDAAGAEFSNTGDVWCDAVGNACASPPVRYLHQQNRIMAIVARTTHSLTPLRLLPCDRSGIIFDPTVQTCLFDDSWSSARAVNRGRRQLDADVNREGARGAAMPAKSSTAESVVRCEVAATLQKESSERVQKSEQQRRLEFKALRDKVSLVMQLSPSLGARTGACVRVQ